MTSTTETKTATAETWGGLREVHHSDQLIASSSNGDHSIQFGHVLQNGIVLNRKSDCTIETRVKRLSRMMQRMVRCGLVISR